MAVPAMRGSGVRPLADSSLSSSGGMWILPPARPLSRSEAGEKLNMSCPPETSAHSRLVCEVAVKRRRGLVARETVLKQKAGTEVGAFLCW